MKKQEIDLNEEFSKVWNTQKTDPGWLSASNLQGCYTVQNYIQSSQNTVKCSRNVAFPLKPVISFLASPNLVIQTFPWLFRSFAIEIHQSFFQNRASVFASFPFFFWLVSEEEVWLLQREIFHLLIPFHLAFQRA